MAVFVLELLASQRCSLVTRQQSGHHFHYSLGLVRRSARVLDTPNINAAFCQRSVYVAVTSSLPSARLSDTLRRKVPTAESSCDERQTTSDYITTQAALAEIEIKCAPAFSDVDFSQNMPNG